MSAARCQVTKPRKSEKAVNKIMSKGRMRGLLPCQSSAQGGFKCSAGNQLAYGEIFFRIGRMNFGPLLSKSCTRGTPGSLKCIPHAPGQRADTQKVICREGQQTEYCSCLRNMNSSGNSPGHQCYVHDIMQIYFIIGYEGEISNPNSFLHTG